MKLVIRSVRTWEHPNIRTWEPDDPEVIAEQLLIDIGPRSEKSSDTFYLRVATPKGLLTLEPKDGILAVRPLVVMQSYNYNNLWNWIERIVQNSEADTWSACIDKLCLYFGWEFSNYKEY